MVHFELKKVFAKRSSQIALLLLLVFVLYLARLQISYICLLYTSPSPRDCS